MPLDLAVSTPLQDDMSSVPSRCPFVASADGSWISQVATADHRCHAVRPEAVLAIPKQRRLCLTPEHAACATYVAGCEARTNALGGLAASNIVWGWARTTPVVETSLGRGATVAGFLADRRGWQVVPAVALVAALGALGLSNLGSNIGPGQATPPASLVGVASPTTVAKTPEPTSAISVNPSVSAGPTVGPSATSVPSPGVTPVPSASASYTVKSGDTLYNIAITYGVTVSALKNFNGLTSNTIRVGQILQIP